MYTIQDLHADLVARGGPVNPVFFPGFDMSDPGGARLEPTPANAQKNVPLNLDPKTCLQGIFMTSPLKFCGFYLPNAPRHPDPKWSGLRQTIVDIGLGIAPFYAGQYSSDAAALTAAQGQTDAVDAAFKM